jgi:hypothetical protein
VNVNLNLKNPVLVRFRMTIVIAIALFVLLTGSLVVFLLTDQWAKRVFFFPDASSRKYAGEVRYLPRSGSEIGDIRAVLTDLLLGPSNFGNAAALPPETKLVSAMLEGQELYVGFSKDILKTGGIPYFPREMLQGVANTIYFNFPWVENIHFFIGGRELVDDTVAHQADRTLDLARRLLPSSANMAKTLRTAERHPLFDPAAAGRNEPMFHDGARWDESILK